MNRPLGSFLLEVLLIYLVLSFLLTLFMMIRMYWVDHKANNKKYGLARRTTLIQTGRWRQMPLYTMDEIKQDKTFGDVRFTFFPNDSGERKKYVIVLPGGGYAHTITVAEGYCIAAKLNEMGYSAFVLEYRTGFSCKPHAPMHDLYRLVKHITENVELYNVDPDDYALVGFSAGGNLAGMYGTDEFGWKKYGTKKPGALILGYPWTNVNHWMDHPYWNIWDGLISIWFSIRGNFFMFGPFATREERDSICVQNWIRSDYPPVYMFAGDDDILVKAGSHTDVMAQALKANQIPYKYERFFRVPHGVGLAEGTNSEGWLKYAVEFWERSVSSEPLESREENM